MAGNKMYAQQFGVPGHFQSDNCSQLETQSSYNRHDKLPKISLNQSHIEPLNTIRSP